MRREVSEGISLRGNSSNSWWAREQKDSEQQGLKEVVAEFKAEREGIEMGKQKRENGLVTYRDLAIGERIAWTFVKNSPSETLRSEHVSFGAEPN